MVGNAAATLVPDTEATGYSDRAALPALGQTSGLLCEQEVKFYLI